MKKNLLAENYKRLFKARLSSNDASLLKEANEPLDPNATYVIQIGTSYEEYDPYEVKKVSGNPLTVAKAVKKKALSDLEDTDAPTDMIAAFKLDNDTYMVVTSEEDVTIVGSPKSKKYGAFWIDPTSDESEELYYEMEDDAGDEI
jgi:hypothetical protein